MRGERNSMTIGGDGSSLLLQRLAPTRVRSRPSGDAADTLRPSRARSPSSRSTAPSVSPTGSSTVSGELLERDAERLRARGLLAALVGALRLQALGAAPASGCRRAGERVLQGPGENAGVIDLGDGLAVAFKVESHNHPSAVEPFQGAATGVGGILRDIVAMGARPIALLDGLRFGAPDWHFRARSPASATTATASASPNVGGETVFDEAYAANPLVNAMCVGLLPTERVLRAKAQGAGQRARPLRRAHRPRRDRRRVRAREPGSRGLRREAPVGADRRPVPRQGADRGLARARRARPRRRRCRTAAPPGSPRRSPRWRATAWASTSTSTACRCASPTSSRGRS